MHKRLWKIDVLRGIAIIGMVLFHANYMLIHIFGVNTLNFSPLFWFFLWKTVATLFIVVAGVSAFLSFSGRGTEYIWRKTFQRFFLLGLCALGISFVTFVFFPEQRISWGIIHFFVLSTLIAPFFRTFGRYTIIVGSLILALPYVWLPEWHSIWLVPIGFPPYGYFSADYYPLLPWFWLYLIGFGLAHFLSERGVLEKVFFLKWEQFSLFRVIGKHSLLFYMLHVPVLYVLFWIVF